VPGKSICCKPTRTITLIIFPRPPLLLPIQRKVVEATIRNANRSAKVQKDGLAGGLPPAVAPALSNPPGRQRSAYETSNCVTRSASGYSTYCFVQQLIVDSTAVVTRAAEQQTFEEMALLPVDQTTAIPKCTAPGVLLLTEDPARRARRSKPFLATFSIPLISPRKGLELLPGSAASKLHRSSFRTRPSPVQGGVTLFD